MKMYITKIRESSSLLPSLHFPLLFSAFLHLSFRNSFCFSPQSPTNFFFKHGSHQALPHLEIICPPSFLYNCPYSLFVYTCTNILCLICLWKFTFKIIMVCMHVFLTYLHDTILCTFFFYTFKHYFKIRVCTGVYISKFCFYLPYKIVNRHSHILLIDYTLALPPKSVKFSQWYMFCWMITGWVTGHKHAKLLFSFQIA